MPGHGAKFGRKQEEAIVALLTLRTTEEVARSVGVATKTLLRWQKDPEFDVAYHAAKRAALRENLINEANNDAGLAAHWADLFHSEVW